MKLTNHEQSIYDEFKLCGQNAKKWMNKCVIMLPKIEKMRIWEKKGFPNIYEFALKLAGMSRNKVNEGLRVLREAEGLPEIQKIIEKKGIWAVRPVLRVATSENQKFWAQKAESMSKSTLETYVRDSLKEKDGHPGVAKNDGAVLFEPNLFRKTEEFNEKFVSNLNKKITIAIDLHSDTAEQLLKIKGKEDWDTLMQEFLEYKEQKERERMEFLEKERPQNVKTKSRAIPMKIQNYVRIRAKNLCEAPNCAKKGEHFHHADPFALKHEHNPDKIRLLCEAHHNLAHQGLIENEDKRPADWRVREFPDIMDFKSVINARVAEFRRG